MNGVYDGPVATNCHHNKELIKRNGSVCKKTKNK